MGGSVGSGGSTQAALPNWQTDVLGNLKSGYKTQKNQFYGFENQDPLLSAAKNAALSYAGGLGGLTSPLTSALGSVSQTIANQGALSPELQRQATQQALTNANPGSLQDPSAIASSVLGRESLRQQNLNTAIGQAQTLTSGIQGLQSGGLNQLLGVGNAAVNQWSTIFNPIAQLVGGYLNDLTQTRTDNAQIAASLANTGTSNLMNWINLGLSGAGKIIGGIAMSDERIKTKIHDIGVETPEGVPLKTFEYKTKPGARFLGVLAQDVEKKAPSAVITESLTGIKMVDATRFPIFKVAPARKGK